MPRMNTQRKDATNCRMRSDGNKEERSSLRRHNQRKKHGWIISNVKEERMSDAIRRH